MFDSTLADYNYYSKIVSNKNETVKDSEEP